MDAKEKIVDKIKKLLRKAHSAEEIGSIEEAQAFAAKAQAMLIEQGLSMSEVDWREAEKQDRLGHIVLRPRKRRHLWIESLAHFVAQAHFCQILLDKEDLGYIFFVGRESNREVASWVFMTLFHAIDKQSHQAWERFRHKFYRAGQSQRPARGYRQSYIDGFVVAIHDRYEEEARKRQGGGENALIVLSGKEVADFVNSLALPTAEAPKSRETEINHAGYREGWQDGMKAPITKQERVA